MTGTEQREAAAVGFGQPLVTVSNSPVPSPLSFKRITRPCDAM